MAILSLEQQQEHLLRVSRTFALTIPLLPMPLQDWVGNAYLLCRIADTIEDDPHLDNFIKVNIINNFIQSLNSPICIEHFHEQLFQNLKLTATESELLLIQDSVEVIERFYSYNNDVQEVLRHGVTIMCKGMSQFDRWNNISSLDEVDHYCYSVAGVVGEILVNLFALYNTSISKKIDKLLPLAISFGEALQLTNILKDVHEDAKRGVEWLHIPTSKLEEKEEYLVEYINIAYGHAIQAKKFIELLPHNELGIRNFCLLANQMAIATLSKIIKNPLFKDVTEIKISRSDVKQIYLECKLFGWSNIMIELLFKLHSSKYLDPIIRDPNELRQKVSYW